MFEASMERFIRLSKPDFIGKAASLRRQQHGQRMKLVTLKVANTTSDCVGNEPIYQGEKRVGLTTSGAYGHAVKESLAMAYLDPAITAAGTRLEVLVMGERRAAEVVADSPWDGANVRLKA